MALYPLRSKIVILPQVIIIPLVIIVMMVIIIIITTITKGSQFCCSAVMLFC